MLQPLTKAKTSLCRSIWSLSTWTGLQLLQASDIGFGVQEIDRWKQNNTFWLNDCCFCDDVFQRSDFLSLSLGVKDGDLSIIAHCRVSPHENNRQNIILNLLQNRIKKNVTLTTSDDFLIAIHFPWHFTGDLQEHHEYIKSFLGSISNLHGSRSREVILLGLNHHH